MSYHGIYKMDNNIEIYKSVYEMLHHISIVSRVIFDVRSQVVVKLHRLMVK